METLISDNFTRHLNLQFSPSLLLFHLPSLSRKNGNFLHFSHRTGRCNPKILTFSSVTASSISASKSYGGWDDPRLAGDSDHSGESDQFRNFLISIGIDDKKYIFMFLLGIVCALAISKVRVSSIVVFPAFVLVFAGGFSFGFVQRGHINGPSISGSKRRSKDEIFRVCTEKLRNLVDFFDGFDVKVSNIKNGIERGIESKQITVGDLESYVEVMESIRLSALSARNVVEASIDGVGFSGNVGESSGILVENQEVERTLNQKPNRRRKEMGESGFDLFQFLGGLFRENSVGPKHNRLKDIVKREGMGTEVNDQTGGNILAPAVEERVLNSASNENAGNANAVLSGDSSNKPALDKDRAEKLNDEARRKKVIPENGNMNSAAMDRISTRLIDSEEYSYQDNRLRPMNNHRISLKTGHHNGIETWASHDSLLDSVDFSVSLKHMETESSFRQEQMLKKSNEAYMPSHSREKSENETYRSFFREERVNPEDDPHLADHQSAHENEVGSSSSSVFSDDVLFDRHLREANDLLKQAKDCLMGKDDEGRAEIILYKSARLLSKAVAMKPMSLLAVGQLGNTYLLHGELKLKISRELRTLLSRSNPLSVDKRRKVLTGLDDQLTSKDKIASFLVNVCEECEELLVEAGRKYRMALSIDGNDARALYNWGLALSFRAQLIADIGPEAAFDADKVFLAAIDKFDALMSKSNVYASDALFRWGGALQQRSRLRPRNSKEKVKLLQQAKRLYEDALHMDSDNLQVRGALSSCISELNFRHF